MSHLTVLCSINIVARMRDKNMAAKFSRFFIPSRKSGNYKLKRCVLTVCITIIVLQLLQAVAPGTDRPCIAKLTCALV